GAQALTGAFPGVPEAFGKGQTLVFYMGSLHIPAIVATLLQRGADADTYCLCASQLSCPGQRLLTAPLRDIEQALADAPAQAPALFVVGDVVALWQKLSAQRVAAE